MDADVITKESFCQVVFKEVILPGSRREHSTASEISPLCHSSHRARVVDTMQHTNGQNQTVNNLKLRLNLLIKL